MRWKIFGCLSMVCILAMKTGGVTVTAESNPFTFPLPGVYDAIREGQNNPARKYQAAVRYVSSMGTVNFSWSFPLKSMAQGCITVYSLRGQTLKKIPLTRSSGTAQWIVAKDGVSGIAIARFSYGSWKRTFKLVLF